MNYYKGFIYTVIIIIITVYYRLVILCIFVFHDLAVYGTKEVLEKLWHDWINGYIRYNKQPDHSVCVQELSQIECPTLIFHGNKDIFVPEYQADFMHERIRNSKLIKWENGKHDLHTKFYKDFNKIVTEFLLD